MATTTTFAKASQRESAHHASAFTKIFLASYGSGAGNQNTKGGWVASASPSSIYAAMELCTVSDMAEWSLAAINEVVRIMPGKTNLTSRDGTSASGVLNFIGNAAGTFRVLHQLYATDGTAIQWSKGDLGLVGALIVNRYSQAGTLISSTVYPDVKAKIESVAPVSNQGDNLQPIMFYQDEARAYTLTSGNLWMPFVFVDDASSLTNAAAPDGSLTAFKLDDCNHSNTTTPPQLVQFDPSATGWKQYFATLRVDGVEVSTSAATWATDTLTFGTAPADGSRIYGIAAINPATYTVPTYHNSTGGMLNLIETVVGII